MIYYINYVICDKEGNETFHNCIECKSNYTFHLNINNSINCLEQCPYYYYIDKISNKTYCTQNLSCPYNYNKLIINKSECIENCEMNSIYKFEFEGICYDTNIQSSIINESKSAKVSQEEFDKSKNSLLSNYNSGNDMEIIQKNVVISLIKTEEQDDDLNVNKTTIDLGECEDKLKTAYNISKNDSLLILKVELKEDGMSIPIIEYEVYYPLYDDNLEKLNLSICGNSKIDISIPVSIEGDIDKYNLSSAYFNDICTRAISDKGTDIPLPDRFIIFLLGLVIISKHKKPNAHVR